MLAQNQKILSSSGNGNASNFNVQNSNQNNNSFPQNVERKEQAEFTGNNLNQKMIKFMPNTNQAPVQTYNTVPANYCAAPMNGYMVGNPNNNQMVFQNQPVMYQPQNYSTNYGGSNPQGDNNVVVIMNLPGQNRQVQYVNANLQQQQQQPMYVQAPQFVNLNGQTQQISQPQQMGGYGQPQQQLYYVVPSGNVQPQSVPNTQNYSYNQTNFGQQQQQQQPQYFVQANPSGNNQQFNEQRSVKTVESSPMHKYSTQGLYTAPVTEKKDISQVINNQTKRVVFEGNSNAYSNLINELRAKVK